MEGEDVIRILIKLYKKVYLILVISPAFAGMFIVHF